MNPPSLLRKLALLLASLLLLASDSRAAEGPYLASGIKIGEVQSDSAIVWVRLTQQPSTDFEALPIFREGLPSNAKSDLMMPTDICPGAEGEVRLSYVATDVAQAVPEDAGSFDRSNATRTEWQSVTAEDDYTHQFQLEGLQPDAAYRILVETRPPTRDDSVTDAASAAGDTSRGASVGISLGGSFRTAPAGDAETPVRFIVSTCQAIRSIDSGSEGHQAYAKMLRFDPHFFVHTGDILYYDKVPLAQNERQARAKWHLIFSYGYQRNFYRQVASYFMKDDHDTLKNDCWPGQRYGDLTFDQGLAIFREQVPMGQRTYRTARWGKDVQVWMTENRDFRSPNNAPDGPDKSILGQAQKQWLMQTIAESDATFKFVISPGPLVGPDKKGKADNHANAVFQHEGQQLRDFLATQPNTFVICGDRHWQYCSVDPQTKLLEMGCGPINDEHDFGGDPGYDTQYHRYFGARGGFLGVTVDGSTAKAEWFSANDPLDEDGRPKVLHVELLPLASQP